MDNNNVTDKPPPSYATVMTGNSTYIPGHATAPPMSTVPFQPAPYPIAQYPAPPYQPSPQCPMLPYPPMPQPYSMHPNTYMPMSPVTGQMPTTSQPPLVTYHVQQPTQFMPGQLAMPPTVLFQRTPMNRTHLCCKIFLGIIAFVLILRIFFLIVSSIIEHALSTNDFHMES